MVMVWLVFSSAPLSDQSERSISTTSWTALSLFTTVILKFPPVSWLAADSASPGVRRAVGFSMFTYSRREVELFVSLLPLETDANQSSAKTRISWWRLSFRAASDQMNDDDDVRESGAQWWCCPAAPPGGRAPQGGGRTLPPALPVSPLRQEQPCV